MNANQLAPCPPLEKSPETGLQNLPSTFNHSVLPAAYLAQMRAEKRYLHAYMTRLEAGSSNLEPMQCPKDLSSLDVTLDPAYTKVLGSTMQQLSNTTLGRAHMPKQHHSPALDQCPQKALSELELKPQTGKCNQLLAPCDHHIPLESRMAHHARISSLMPEIPTVQDNATDDIPKEGAPEIVANLCACPNVTIFRPIFADCNTIAAKTSASSQAESELTAQTDASTHVGADSTLTALAEASISPQDKSAVNHKANDAANNQTNDAVNHQADTAVSAPNHADLKSIWVNPTLGISSPNHNQEHALSAGALSAGIWPYCGPWQQAVQSLSPYAHHNHTLQARPNAKDSQHIKPHQPLLNLPLSASSQSLTQSYARLTVFTDFDDDHTSVFQHRSPSHVLVQVQVQPQGKLKEQPLTQLQVKTMAQEQPHAQTQNQVPALVKATTQPIPPTPLAPLALPFANTTLDLTEPDNLDLWDGQDALPLYGLTPRRNLNLGPGLYDGNSLSLVKQPSKIACTIHQMLSSTSLGLNQQPLRTKPEANHDLWPMLDDKGGQDICDLDGLELVKLWFQTYDAPETLSQNLKRIAHKMGITISAQDDIPPGISSYLCDKPHKLQPQPPVDYHFTPGEPKAAASTPCCDQQKIMVSRPLSQVPAKIGDTPLSDVPNTNVDLVPDLAPSAKSTSGAATLNAQVKLSAPTSTAPTAPAASDTLSAQAIKPSTLKAVQLRDNQTAPESAQRTLLPSAIPAHPSELKGAQPATFYDQKNYFNLHPAFSKIQCSDLVQRQSFILRTILKYHREFYPYMMLLNFLHAKEPGRSAEKQQLFHGKFTVRGELSQRANAKLRQELGFDLPQEPESQGDFANLHVCSTQDRSDAPAGQPTALHLKAQSTALAIATTKETTVASNLTSGSSTPQVRAPKATIATVPDAVMENPVSTLAHTHALTTFSGATLSTALATTSGATSLSASGLGSSSSSDSASSPDTTLVQFKTQSLAQHAPTLAQAHAQAQSLTQFPLQPQIKIKVPVMDHMQFQTQAPTPALAQAHKLTQDQAQDQVYKLAQTQVLAQTTDQALAKAAKADGTTLLGYASAKVSQNQTESTKPTESTEHELTSKDGPSQNGRDQNAITTYPQGGDKHNEGLIVRKQAQPQRKGLLHLFTHKNDEIKQLHLQPVLGAQRQNILLSQLRHNLTFFSLSLMSLAIGFVAVGGLIYQSSQSQLIPYVVTVDSHGVVLNQGTASQVNGVPKQVVTAQLCDFIRNVRMLTSDEKVQQQSILKAYAFVRPGSSVGQQLNSYYTELNPFEKAKEKEVHINIANAIETGENTFQIDWLEQLTPNNTFASAVSGSAASSSAELEAETSKRSFSQVSNRKMRAIISYSVQPTNNTNADDLLLNPLGIFVEKFTISPILG